MASGGVSPLLSNPEELPIELLHGEMVCSGILGGKDDDPVILIEFIHLLF